MAITGAALIAPEGEVELSLFPGNSSTQLQARFDVYITEGYTKAPGNDDAARAWAYHRAYFAVYLRMSSQPINSELVDQASAVFDKDQARRFYDLSMAKEEEFNAILDLGSPAPKLTGSGPANTVIRW